MVKCCSRNIFLKINNTFVVITLISDRFITLLVIPFILEIMVYEGDIIVSSW